MRASRTIVLLALASACAGPSGTAVRPEFPPPRGGVFQAPVPVVKSTDDDLLPSIVPTSALVAYAAKVERNLDIYVRPIAGGAAVRLTSHSADDTDPEFSPDGRSIAWTSQADDVKGDIWVMDADGDDARRLTDRDTADRGPTWSPDGRVIFFTSRARGTAVKQVDAYNLDTNERRTVVDNGWDPTISSDGSYMFYVALDDRPQPRIFVRRTSDGQVAALTDGTYIEGIPRVARGVATTRVLFTRWVDDQTGDGVVDVDDAPSLWAVDFADTLFVNGVPATARPLTAGEGGEIFASVASDWLVFTTAGFGDLEIYALPGDGVINAGAGPEAILEAARAEDNPALRRLALRYLVATTPSLAASARYELARELAERGRLSDAIDELARVIEVADGDVLEGVARIEVERLRMLERLRGSLTIREEAERRFTRERVRDVETIAAGFADEPRVQVRAENTLGEAEYALGRRDRAIITFDGVVRREDVPAEDGARALDRLGEIFANMHSLDAVARISEATLRKFASERHYARRAAERWVATARSSVGAPVLAALEHIVRTHPDLPTVAARAAVALAREQEAGGHDGAAIEQWKLIASEYTSERAIQADALITLGEAAERQGQRAEAIDAYERLIGEFPERAQLRSRALQGLTRIALTKARLEEHSGEKEKARQSYGRLLRNNRELAHAHRRYIALSAELGELEPVLEQYRSAAEAKPRDKFARYGHGYALAFETPPSLGDIEREVEAALALDPRLAAAHVTLGWVRELRHERDPRGGWVEKAVSSYETAWSLVDEKNEPELWAAAKLNHGNALLTLGKTDFALQAYLDRELSQVPFNNPITELLFRQRFAQTALREGALDVALDMAGLGYAKAQSMPGQPRLGSMAALNAAIALSTGSYEDAAVWFERARVIYEDNLDWQRVVPMLRGRALALEMLGRRDEAFDAWSEILAHLEADRGPEDMDYCWSKPALRLFGIWIPMRIGFLEQEIAANSQSVTGAICGFSAEQEQEIARHTAARLLEERGDIERARTFDTRRLELAEEAASDSRRGVRVQRELAHALNASALLAVRAGDWMAAVERWQTALPILRTLGGCADLLVDARAKGPLCTAQGLEIDTWQDAAVMLESLAELWTTEPAVRAEPLLSEALRTASVGIEATATSAPEVSRRLARWLALDRLTDALAPPRVEAADAAVRFTSLMSHLDTAVARLEESQIHAQVADAAELVQHVARLGSPGVDDDEARSARIAAAPPSWRVRFDRSLWDRGSGVRGPDPNWLLAAVDAFESDPQPAAALERRAFLAAAVQMLIASGKIERAWRLLERDRLLAWQPPSERVGGELARAWQQVRALHAEPDAYRAALARAPALVRALEGDPATVAEVQRSLGERGLLLQAFAPRPGQVHFFAVDSFGVSHMQGTSTRTIPEALLAHIAEPGSNDAPRFYVDAGDELADALGELSLRDKPLRGSYAASEILSATYLVAAWSARNLARAGVLAVGSNLPEAVVIPADAATTTSLAQGRDRAIVHLALPTRFQQPRLQRPGASQLRLISSATTPSAERLDLDGIAALDLDANLVVASQLSPGARPARALLQALLLAGVPSLVLAPLPAARLSRLSEDLEKERLIDALDDDERLLGFHGLDFQERVAFAVAEYARLDAAGKKVYVRAKKSNDDDDWRAARRVYESALDTLAFLGEPEPSAVMAASDDAKVKKLAKRLDMTAVGKRVVLAQILIRLDDLDGAVALQDLVIETFEKAGNLKPAVTVLNLVGQNLAKGDRHEEAIVRFQRCVDLAREEAKLAKFEGECLSRLGTEKRALLDYPSAVTYYEEAIAVYEELSSPTQITTRRFLGFLYESALNDYPRALEQFQQALDAAEALKVSAQLPGLMLDIVRIFRSQGDYEEALARALAAQERLPAIPSAEAAAAMEEKEIGQIHKRQADVSLEIAKIYWYRGNYRRAVEHQSRGLELARAARDAFREIQAVSLAGLIALNQGELERAERSIRAALHMARAADRDEEVAKQLNNLGTVLREAGRIPEAIERFREALAIDEKLGSVEGRAYDLRNLAVALHRQGELDEALERVTEALELSRSIGEQYNQLRALFAAGEILDAIGDASSHERYQAAAQLAQRTAVPEVEWRSVYALGRHAQARGDLELARQLLDESLQVAERLGRGQSSTSADHNRDDLYADAIGLAVAADDAARAYQYIERARGRDLLDVLASRTLQLPSSEAKAAMAVELRAREAVMAARRDVRLGLRGAAQRLADAEQKHRQTLDALRTSYPRLARTFTIDPVAAGRLRESLPAGTVVVSYFVGREHTTAITINAEGINAVTIELRADELTQRVQRLRESMRAFGAVDDDIAQLSDWLVAPLRSALEGARVLVVLPHGPLHYVPFAALPIDGEPLLTRMVTATAPSGSVLFDQLQQPTRARPEQIAVMAPAADLPFARLEALAIAGDRAVLGSDATEAAVRATRADALDLAAHGRLDGRDPLASAIELRAGGDDDGRLEMHEIFALRGLPPLITLSACDTASPQEVRGTEWLSLGGAFLTAGARTVIATQNRVSDLAASVMMKRFYRAVREQAAGEALRSAALSAREYFPHPAHWSSFVLMGDFR